MIADGGLDADDRSADEVHDAIEQSLPRSTPGKLAETLANRVNVERAVGILMRVYDMDADNAFELMKWGAHALEINITLLATQLTESCDKRSHRLVGLARYEQVDLQSVCDDLLFAAHERSPRLSRQRRKS